MKRILITGKDSYIGTSVEKWLLKTPEKYQVETLDVKGEEWKNHDFSKYDVVFHVAAVVHKKEQKKMKELYSKVNTALPIEIARKAKISGVTQFIFMSTMAVYGQDGKLNHDVIIDNNTPVIPKSFYGLSKLEAEFEILKLNDNIFRVVILRPPIIYGDNCPGNYAKLEKLACILPVFPLVENKRSMLHIDKFSQIIIEKVNSESCGIYFPQDDQYVNTSELVRNLAKKNQKSIYLSKTLGTIVKLFGTQIKSLNKLFGNLVYDKEIESVILENYK